MAKENSFDIVSEPDWGEITNAVDQAQREVGQRFDFRGHNPSILWDRKAGTITLEAPAGMLLEALVTVVEQKLARREVSLRFFDRGEPEPHGAGRARLVLQVKQGLDADQAKKIQQAIRAMKLKVETQIQGEAIRVSAKSRDDLQAVIRNIKAQDFGIELAFTNYR